MNDTDGKYKGFIDEARITRGSARWKESSEVNIKYLSFLNRVYSFLKRAYYILLKW